MSEDQREALWQVRQNAAMAQTPAERQEARRARLLMEGMTEVRGIYAPPALHAVIKEFAQRLVTAEAKSRPIMQEKK